MSKAFTKDDAPETPLVVPPRAPLPSGVPNYVTARGMALLRAELTVLEAERRRVTADIADETERTRRLAVIAARIAELSARVSSATVVDPRGQPPDLVRFGVTVTLRTVSGETPGEERRLTIVGVDEAAAAEGRVAFLAPIARAILGRQVGESATLETARGEEVLEILAIDDEAS
jgi:transcription elongation factor GreB